MLISYKNSDSNCIIERYIGQNGAYLNDAYFGKNEYWRNETDYYINNSYLVTKKEAIKKDDLWVYGMLSNNMYKPNTSVTNISYISPIYNVGLNNILKVKSSQGIYGGTRFAVWLYDVSGSLVKNVSVKQNTYSYIDIPNNAIYVRFETSYNSPDIDAYIISKAEYYNELHASDFLTEYNLLISEGNFITDVEIKVKAGDVIYYRGKHAGEGLASYNSDGKKIYSSGATYGNEFIEYIVQPDVVKIYARIETSYYEQENIKYPYPFLFKKSERNPIVQAYINGIKNQNMNAYMSMPEAIFLEPYNQQTTIDNSNPDCQIVTFASSGGAYDMYVKPYLNILNSYEIVKDSKLFYCYTCEAELIEATEAITISNNGYNTGDIATLSEVGEKVNIIRVIGSSYFYVNKPCKIKFSKQRIVAYSDIINSVNSHVDTVQDGAGTVNQFPDEEFKRYGIKDTFTPIALHTKKDFVFQTFKKLSVLGDSIFSPAYKVFSTVASYLNVELNNLAVGFSYPLAGGEGTTENLCNLRDAQLSKLTADTDVLVIGGGQNKWVTSEDKSAENLDRNTSIGAINYAISYMRNLNPKCVIFLCPTLVNHINESFKDIIHDDYRDIATNNDVYLIPLDEMLNYQYDEKAKVLRADGVHPTYPYGAQRFAACIISEIKRYIL